MLTSSGILGLNISRYFENWSKELVPYPCHDVHLWYSVKDMRKDMRHSLKSPHHLTSCKQSEDFPQKGSVVVIHLLLRPLVSYISIYNTIRYLTETFSQERHLLLEL